MKNYIVVGGSHLQADFIKKVKDNGFFTHVVDYDPKCAGAELADVFHCISIDDKEKILALASSLNIAGIHTVATEQGNITSNYVAEKLGLPCNGYTVVLNTTDKARMKKVLDQHKINTPRSLAVSCESELSTLDIIYPVIVKASDRSAGRGVSLASNINELLSCFKVAKEESFNKIVLIEDYFDAPQYSIETISCNGQHKVIAITQMGFSGPPDFVETEHVLPASISRGLYERLKDYTIKSLNAFGIEYGACHIEVRVKDDIVSMIEIASRMGGLRHWMVEAALGIDYLQAILNSSLGQDFKVPVERNNFTSFSCHIFDAKDYEQYELNKEAGVNFVVDFVKPGIPAKQATNLIEAHGFYIFVKEDDVNVNNH